MTLTLRAVSLNDHPLTQPITVHFDAAGGSIGRADHNTMALPDPERHISRQQAEVSPAGHGFVIRNVGSANPIVVGSRPLARGESAALAQGDRLRIGGYLLEVEVEEGASPASASITRGRAAVDAVTPSHARRAAHEATAAEAPLGVPGIFGGDTARPLAPGNPFAELFGSDAGPAAAPLPASRRAPPPPSPLPPAPAPSRPSALSPPQPQPLRPPPSPAPRLPDDFDPFAEPPSAAPPAAPAYAAGGVFGDLVPGVEPAGIDRAFGLEGLGAFDPGDGRDLLADFLATPVDPRARPGAARTVPERPSDAADLRARTGAAPARAALDADPLVALGFGPAPPRPGPAPSAAPDRVPEWRAAYSPPKVLAAAPPSGSPAAAVLSPVPATAHPSVVADPPPRWAIEVPSNVTVTAPSNATAAVPSTVVPATPPTFTAETRPMFLPDTPPRFVADTPPKFAAGVPPNHASDPPPSSAHDAPPKFAAAEAASPARPTLAPAASTSSWDAFCAGAGVALPRPEAGEPEAMRAAGELLRAAVDGLLRLMAVRASAKHELHAPVTVIRSQHNNPLKFSPDADAALEQLLQPPLRGFMPAGTAVVDATDDLVAHAVGSLAGTRAALEGVLDRFAPRQLEAKLVDRPVLDSVLPMNRRARLWELYVRHFETIRSEAQDDFHSLFGRAFLAAYEQQVERLKAG